MELLVVAYEQRYFDTTAISCCDGVDASLEILPRLPLTTFSPSR